MKKTICLLFLYLALVSCGEESLTKNTQNSEFRSSDIQSFEVSTCSQMTLRKPPVDILYVIDNTGSTLAGSFQAIKSEIEKTVSTISSEFDYHIYFTPLNASSTDTFQSYPLVVSDPDSIPSLSGVSQTSIENIEMFAPASGNNKEFGIARVKNLINNNRSNGIFRDNAHTIVVLISNGDDTEALTTIAGNQIVSESTYSRMKTDLQMFTTQYAQANPGTPGLLNAQTFRFISLVAHSTCNGWKRGAIYKRMSKDIYEYQNLTDSPSKDSLDLCSQNYSELFASVNASIRSVVDGHKYDHWKISSASESAIQQDDITVTKVNGRTGTQTAIPADSNNGFEYLGFVQDQKLTYEPADANERASGLMIKLNGSARVEFPDCIIAKTRTPTEYFGYFAFPREPDVDTIEVEIAGVKYPQSSTNGWTYIGYRDILNIKVPGPTNASITPANNKSGFFIQLHGDAIFTNGTTIKVFFKGKSQ